MRVGHLFAGIDGIGLGLHRHGFVPAWFSEYEAAPSKVLAHHYPAVPNHGDITAIDWTQVEPVDVLTGGFPCQDISKAGKGAGIKEGTRSGLWFEYVRAVRALRPAIVIVENVSALLTRGLDVVLGDLAACGFDAEWSVLRASDVGAAHRRERLFIVAHVADGDGVRRLHGGPGVHAAEAGVDAFGDVAAGGHPDAPYAGCERHGGGEDAREVGCLDAGDEGPARQRQRARQEPCDRSAEAAADRPCAERREPQLKAVGASAGSAAEPRERAGEAAWGEFLPAIRRWERALGRPAPSPVDDRGRLSPDFVEWHMGFPPGWTSMLTRTERLKALGNAVVPQCADAVGRWALDIVTREVAA